MSKSLNEQASMARHPAGKNRTPVPAEFQGLGDITPNQKGFLERLLRERDYELPKPLDHYTKDEASVLIEDVKRAPRKEVGIVVEAGMYMTPEEVIFKVQKAVHGSGRLYAKRLRVVTEPERDDEGDIVQPGKIVFDYESGAIYTLTPDMKMTYEEAVQFGALYGTCVRCGRTLTKEKSIERAMGPVCSRKENWA